MSKKLLVANMLLLFVVIFAIGCAAGPNPAVHTPVADGSVVGFWFGLWHGTISPITFIISLFNDNVHIYEVHNNGGWYNFGFMLGIGAFCSGSSASTRR